MEKSASAKSGERFGIKHFCKKCGIKFYDFNKDDIRCPKCQAEVSLGAATGDSAIAPPAAKKPVVARSQNEIEDGAEGSDFEALDDLDQDDERIVEDLAVDDDDLDDDEF